MGIEQYQGAGLGGQESRHIRSASTKIAGGPIYSNNKKYATKENYDPL